MHKPFVIAHRGASAYAPENTIAAFNKALDMAADGIEIDVHLTKDRH
ncbi:MAG: glycerophosphodiester phosphodiesterase, partial [Clostridiaceae bacterium]|nr:glycerophosphodiester phosphodiesterase [Clostridiaceae bacterium]